MNQAEEYLESLNSDNLIWVVWETNGVNEIDHAFDSKELAKEYKETAEKQYRHLPNYNIQLYPLKLWTR